MEIKFVFASSDTSWGDRFLFWTMLNDSLWYVFFRYDLDSGIQDTIGNHDDLATCVEYCDETCKLLMLLCFECYWCLICILNVTLCFSCLSIKVL